MPDTANKPASVRGGAKVTADRGEVSANAGGGLCQLSIGKALAVRVSTPAPFENRHAHGIAAEMSEVYITAAIPTDRARELRDVLVALFDRLDEEAGTKPVPE